MFNLRKTVGSMRMFGAWEMNLDKHIKIKHDRSRTGALRAATPLECCGTCVRGFAQLVNTPVATELHIR